MDDWQSGKSLKERMQFMLQEQFMCDVTFLVGAPGYATHFSAHKYMLASASRVFFSMFTGQLQEKGDVKITDIEPVVFNLMLQFIYSEDVEINFDNVEGLLFAADKYFIQLLKDKCICFLQDHLNYDYVFKVLQLAFDLILEELKSNALDYIWKNGPKCLSSELFLELGPEYVEHIIKSDKLRCKDEHIYQEMVKWAKLRCANDNLSETDQNIRKCLGNLLRLIRFPTMEQGYFTRNIFSTDILTLEEKLDVFQSKTNIQSTFFNSEKRHYQVHFQRCTSDYRNVAVLDCTSEDDCVDFQTSFNGRLCSLFLFGPKTYSGSNDLKVNILSGPLLLSTTKTTLKSKPKTQIYEIHLNQPVEICEQNRYTIVVNMRGPKTFKGKDYKQICKADGLSITFLPPSMSSPNNTNEKGGQIPGLVFDIYT